MRPQTDPIFSYSENRHIPDRIDRVANGAEGSAT